MTIKLLVATHNQGKVEEYKELLADLPLEITWLDAEAIDLDVEETGDTFKENAILKAQAYARESNLLTWADDSGLEVDALDGWPGVNSARQAGPNASDADRTTILLDKLSAIPAEKRTAAFRCVVAIATPSGDVFTSSGASNGVIITQPRGENGFGYDPVFFVPKYQRTYAELSPSEKHSISHRGRASRKAKVQLKTFLEK